MIVCDLHSSVWGRFRNGAVLGRQEHISYAETDINYFYKLQLSNYCCHIMSSGGVAYRAILRWLLAS